MSLENISEEEWVKGAEEHGMSVEEFKKAVEEQWAEDNECGCGCGHDHHVEVRKFEDFSEEELIEGAKANGMELEEFKEALKEHLEDLENHQIDFKTSIEDFSEEELIEGAKENNMELEEFKKALAEYLEELNSGCGCGCGGHNDDHECCGGHNHDKGNGCCGGH